MVPEAGTTSERRLHHTPVTGPATVSAWAPCAAPYRRSLTLGDGSYVLEVRLTDAYGNTGPGVEGTPYVLDTTPPAAPTVGKPTVAGPTTSASSPTPSAVRERRPAS